MKLADMTNTDGSGCAPSTTPQLGKPKRATLREVVRERRKAVNKTRDSAPEEPWARGT